MSDIEAIKKRLAAATPGPWRWVIDLRRKDIRLDAGSLVVMDFARYGMQGAQPRFRLPQYGDVLMEMSELAKELPAIADWPHPDADMIRNAPTDIATLLDELARVVEERDRLKAALKEIDRTPVGACEVGGGSMPEPCEQCGEMRDIAARARGR